MVSMSLSVIPTSMLFNQAGALCDDPMAWIKPLISISRLVALVIAWVVLFVEISHSPSLAVHLREEPNCGLLFLIASFGTLLYMVIRGYRIDP